MNSFSFLIVLFYVFYSVDCIVLTNLCKEDVFRFNKTKHSKEQVLVNSFFAIPFEVRLEAIGEYMISEIKEKKFDSDSLRQLVIGYEELLLELYNEKYITNLYEQCTDLYSKVMRYNQLEQDMRNIITYGRGFDDDVTTVRNLYYKRMIKTKDLLKNLEKACMYTLSSDFINATVLGGKLEKIDFTEEQISVFCDLPLNAYYTKPIMQVKEMKLQRKSKLFFSPDSTGTIYLDIYAPFENLNYDNEIKNGCKQAKTLPAFFDGNDN